MPSGVGGGISPAIPVKPGEGTLWAFITGTWQAASLATFLAASPLVDASTFVVGDLDATKRLGFQSDTQATASTLTIDVGAQTASRTLTVPVLAGADTIATLAVANVFTANQRINGRLGIGTVAGSVFHLSADAAVLDVFQLDNTNATNPHSWKIGPGAGLSAGFGLYDNTNGVLALYVLNAAGNQFVMNGTSGARVAATTTAISPIVGSFIVGDGSTAATNVALGGGVAVIGTRLSIGVYNSSTLLNISGDMAASDGLRFANTGTNPHVWSIGPNSGGGASFNWYDATNGAVAFSIANASGNLVTITGTSGFSVASTVNATAIGTAGTVLASGLSVAQSIWCCGTAGNFINIANATGALKINSTQVVGAQITGYGIPTGNSRLSAFPGASASLAQCSAQIAQMIIDLKTHGLLGA